MSNVLGPKTKTLGRTCTFEGVSKRIHKVLTTSGHSRRTKLLVLDHVFFSWFEGIHSVEKPNDKRISFFRPCLVKKVSISLGKLESQTKRSYSGTLEGFRDMYPRGGFYVKTYLSPLSRLPGDRKLKSIKTETEELPRLLRTKFHKFHRLIHLQLN